VRLTEEQIADLRERAKSPDSVPRHVSPSDLRALLDEREELLAEIKRIARHHFVTNDEEIKRTKAAETRANAAEARVAQRLQSAADAARAFLTAIDAVARTTTRQGNGDV